MAKSSPVTTSVFVVIILVFVLITLAGCWYFVLKPSVKSPPEPEVFQPENHSSMTLFDRYCQTMNVLETVESLISRVQSVEREDVESLQKTRERLQKLEMRFASYKIHESDPKLESVIDSALIDLERLEKKLLQSH